MIQRLARIGCPLTQADGTFYRTQSYGQPGPLWINFNGKQIKVKLYKEARRLRARMLPQVNVTDLLTRDGRVVGAVGVHIKTGEFHVIRAKSTILATGNTNRVYKNPTGYRFNTWLCPANTGAAQAMALRVGAELTNMEYMRWTVVPMGFAAAGLNALTGMGGRLINGSGEEFMRRYHPLGDRAPRYKLVEAVYTEIVEGRGPVAIDCRHLNPADLKHLRDLLGWDKETLPEFIMAKNIDLSRDPLPVAFSEGMQCGPAEVCSSGVKVDEQLRATVPGLFAAGDAADQNRCLHLCLVGGSHAGKWAAHWAANTPEPEIDCAEVARAKEFALAPLRETSGIDCRQVEDAIGDIMWRYVGPVRTERSLLRADALLDELRERVEHLQARNLHELLRAHEVKTMWEVAKVTTHASLFRKESRFGVYFNRKDYPETKEEWCGLVCVSRRDGRLQARFQPLTYEIPPLVDAWPPATSSAAD